MYYRNELGYEYPDRPDAHMISVKRVRRLEFGTEYPYLDKTLRFRLMRGVYWLLVNLIVFPVMRLSHGLRIFGKKNIKKHGDVLRNGAITISNHVFYWDYLAVLKAIRPHLSFFPAWKDNLEGPCGTLIRLSGGIPVPNDNLHAMIKFNRAVEEILQEGKWLHFFPEGSMWFFYPDIRPLKKAVFTYAVKHNKPVLPITMSFRPRRGITRLFTKTPCVDLHIGEPLLPRKDLPAKQAEAALRAEAYHVMQVMNGIEPGDPTYRTVQDAEDYQKTM